MKKVLVTGGVGFIGTNLIKSLLKKDIKVVSLDNYSTGYKLNEMKGVKYYNCLLYTSPSPRDRTRSRMPSSA